MVADTPRDEDEELRHPAAGKNASGVEPKLIITDPGLPRRFTENVGSCGL
jgi:hypothetical protein